MIYIPILASILCSSLAQIFLKMGMLNFQGAFHPSIGLLFKLFTNPFVLLGTGMHILALLIWLYVLKNVEVSFAYPFISLGFIFVLFISALFLNEGMSVYKIAGTFVIVAGILVLSHH